MKVKEVMTPNATGIWLTESLADAAKLMWDSLLLGSVSQAVVSHASVR